MRYPFNGEYELTQGFMQPNAALLGGHHRGVDWAMPERTPVLAINGGEVVKIGLTTIEGRFVVIRHSWGESWYMHLFKINCSVGDQISEGLPFAESGNTGLSTGPHLHLMTIRDGVLVDPVQLITNSGAVAPGAYVVPFGGSLSQAAQDMGCSLDELISANPSYASNPDFVIAGATLAYPSTNAQKVHVVKAGDTLSQIAESNGQSLEEVLSKNPKFRENPDLIHPGDVVTL